MWNIKFYGHYISPLKICVLAIQPEVMDNFSILTDFDFTDHRGKFYPIQSPEDMKRYSIHAGGANFIFVTNDYNKTVRFSHWNNGSTKITDDQIRNWISLIKEKIGKF